jgi:streptogramin lyase
MAVLGSCAAPARHGAGVPTRHRASSRATPRTARRPVVKLPLGGEVDGLALGGGYLWAYVRESGVLTRVDQRTAQARHFALPAWRGLPVVVAASQGAVWLANQHSSRPDLIRLDPQSGRIVARPRLPGDTGAITGLVAAYGWLWVLVPDGAHPPGWRVIRVNPSTNRVDGVSADTPGTQFTGHTAAIWASAGQVWMAGSMNAVVSLDPHTLAMHTTATPQESAGWVFGDGYAWALNLDRPVLAEIDPHTGKAVRRLATPPPSATGDDDVAAGHNVLWVFRGSRLTELDARTGQVLTRASADPLAPALYMPAVVTSTSLWYLAQTSTGTALDRIVSPPASASPPPSRP